MPKLIDFIRAEKTGVDEGIWQSGHVTPAAFPMSKARKKHLKFGPDYKWRLVKFTCLGLRCRVLILFNGGKLICRSTFAVEQDNDLVILCTHEYHANHPGWHCHVATAPHERVAPGVFRTGQKRWPKAKARHSRIEYGITQASALAHVATRYQFQAQGSLV